MADPHTAATLTVTQYQECATKVGLLQNSTLFKIHNFFLGITVVSNTVVRAVLVFPFASQFWGLHRRLLPSGRAAQVHSVL